MRISATLYSSGRDTARWLSRASVIVSPEAICFGLETELPLRGAIAVGEAILEEEKGVFLGLPLVEVARTERIQQWIGASFGRFFSRPGFNDGFHMHTILPYKSHYKDSAGDLATGIVLDWPRRWRESRSSDPRPVLAHLNTNPAFSEYYLRSELRQDLRAVLKKCRPDWNISTPELKAAW